jgi:hypothetical protein
VVHFSGHGTKTGKIVFEDSNRKPEAVSIKDLSDFFSSYKMNIKCVVLNACYSKDQADAISKYIDCAIGTDTEISDDTARVFSDRFYLNLAYGQSVEKAFNAGKLQLRFMKLIGGDGIKLQPKHGINPSEVIIVESVRYQDTENLEYEKYEQHIRNSHLNISADQTIILNKFSTGKRIRERTYHAFLSCKDSDRKTVDALYHWLNDIASIPIWYDSRDLPLGNDIENELLKAIAKSRSIILVLSETSIASGWAERQYVIAKQHQKVYSEFRILPLRIGSCKVPDVIRTASYVDITDEGLDIEIANKLLFSLYYNDNESDFEKQDLFISRSWREETKESEFADSVCNLLINQGYRLIGDSKDQQGFYGKDNEGRVRSIISSCEGFVSILPHRGKGTTSKFMLREIEMAKEIGLPCLVVADSNVLLPPELEESTTQIDPSITTGDVERILSKVTVKLREDLRNSNRPPQPHYIFFAIDFLTQHEIRNSLYKRHLQLITAMECIIANQVIEVPVQENILKKISNAFMMIADVSKGNDDTLIEAGIAMGASLRENLHLIAKRPLDCPPFMISGKQITYYSDDLELLGIIHSIGYRYRRTVLNYEGYSKTKSNLQ